MLRRPAWLSVASRRRDTALAFGVAALGLVEVFANGGIEPRPLALVCELGMGAALIWRRPYPLLTVLAVSVLATAEAVGGVPVDQPFVPIAAYMVATYSLVSLARQDRIAIGIAGIVVGLAVQVVDQHKGVGNFAFAAVLITPIYVAARTARARTERTLELEREQDERAAVAVEDERRRIARELHDVIAHSLGVLVLQAGAAEQVLDRDPARAREVLRSIRATGNEAIAELGPLLALARGEVESSREPQPSLADLDALGARMRKAGLPTEIVVEGVRRELPAAVEVSAYRIVQEGLTNALKHSGAASARVHVRYGRSDVEVEVSDDGAGAGAVGGSGSGRGLHGVGERVALFGGRFHAGPRDEGGWLLRAAIPIAR